jgi:hypothetical protein
MNREHEPRIPPTLSTAPACTERVQWGCPHEEAEPGGGVRHRAGCGGRRCALLTDDDLAGLDGLADLVGTAGLRVTHAADDEDDEARPASPVVQGAGLLLLTGAADVTERNGGMA